MVEGAYGADAFDTAICHKGVEGGEVLFHRFVESQQVGSEIGAFHYFRSGVFGVGVVGLHIAGLGKIEHLQRFGGVQLATVAFVVLAVPVVDSVGGVGCLLYLGNEQAFAESVHPSAGDEKHVAFGGTHHV